MVNLQISLTKICLPTSIFWTQIFQTVYSLKNEVYKAAKTLSIFAETFTKKCLIIAHLYKWMISSTTLILCTLTSLLKKSKLKRMRTAVLCALMLLKICRPLTSTPLISICTKRVRLMGKVRMKSKKWRYCAKNSWGNKLRNLDDRWVRRNRESIWRIVSLAQHLKLARVVHSRCRWLSKVVTFRTVCVLTDEL